MVAVFLVINRVDLAQKLVAQTRVWCEDAPIAQLAEAWTGLLAGGSKYGEASYIFDELAQASSASSARLLTAQAVCRMHLAQFPEALELLQEALEKDANAPDTLANLVVCASHAGLPQETRSRHLAQLRHAAPAHPFVVDLDAKAVEFDAAAAKLGSQ
ncbi:hypothetical protein LPJ61_002291 [Coemansia biformis]|uniref:Coatomer subunit epsilon n=1 Tax=Coemansia biformis TaxID=1286918 RepID=A0A9W7YDL5_9FUNG|nr:hypothetical protein LPJ61_002291 [Coemansia biformis]